MTIRLDIGPENTKAGSTEPISSHVLNVSTIDELKKNQAHQKVSLNLKEEIKAKNAAGAGRICIVGETQYAKQGLGRAPMIFGALAMILLLNMGQMIFLGKKQGNEALVLASEAFVSLKDASEAVISGEEGADLLLFEEAEVLFSEAEMKGKFLLKHESEWLPAPGQVQNLRALLDAGTLMAEVGTDIAEARAAFSEIPSEGSLTDFVRGVSDNHLSPAYTNLQEINALLSEVDLSSTSFQEEFLDFRGKIESLIGLFELWFEVEEPLMTMLGDRYPQRYLILLMNNDEMRPGGGFIGSFLLADVNDGRLTNWEFHDVYEFDNRLSTPIEVPIHELKELTLNWRLRDSNIYPDFPSSAREAMRFLELEGGPGVDAVIGVNLSSAQAFLEATGPLSIPSLSQPLTSENLPIVLSTLVEAKVYGRHTPKDILKEIIPAFIAQADSMNIQKSLFNAFLNESEKKQILIYHEDPEVQTLLKDFNLDGALPKLGELEGDFLLPVFTNIGGNKTDRYVSTDIYHETHVFDDGSIVNELKITRSNAFNEATWSWIESTMASFGFADWNETLKNILGDDLNETGIRLYIPEGSLILETQGVLRDELQLFYDSAQDLSYYYLEQALRPGETQSFTILYALPWYFRGDFKEHNFHLYKQPGLKSVTFKKTIAAPDDMLLSSRPLSPATEEGFDYSLGGSLLHDVAIELLYR